MEAKFNFSAGPAMLPAAVLSEAAAELSDWRGLGFSVMEISHRSEAFDALAKETESDLRLLLDIPEDYAIVFLQGGASAQFALAPMNLLDGRQGADYLDTGHWSQKAICEAQKYCEVNIVARCEEQRTQRLPERERWQLNPEAAYFYYVANETIDGIEFDQVPRQIPSTLVCDMSSNLLSRPVNVRHFGLIHACAQKNIGPAGISLLIIERELMRRKAHALTPSVFRYDLQNEAGSRLNTPPTFAWYMAGRVFRWLLDQGGIQEIEKRNIRKARKLYALIDSSDFYSNPVAPECRSRMNIPVILAENALDSEFLSRAEEAGLCNLKGHRSVGGMRASIYNAMPEEGVDALVKFMMDFERSRA